MVNFVSFDDFDNLLCRICTNFNLDLSEVLTSKLDKFGIFRKTIWTWNELDNLDENELFETENTNNFDQKIYLINFENLAIDKNSSQFLANYVQKNQQNSDQNVNQTPNQIYLYSQNLTTTDKTLLKKHKISFTDLKIDEKTKINLATQYQQKLGLNLTNNEIEELTFETTSLVEIINKIDFLSLTENPKKYLPNVCKTREILLFTLGLDKIQRWYNLVGDDNLQLALSLIFGKLEKKNMKLVKLVVQTDKRIKTRGGIKPILWWKMLLWNLEKEI